MTAPLPESIVVCGHRYDVKMISDPDEALHRAGDPNSLGVSDHSKCRIRIRDGEQSESQYRDTMLHEVLHAIVAQTYAQKAFAKEDDEQAVAVLSTHLLDTLRRNPALVAYLVNEAQNRELIEQAVEG